MTAAAKERESVRKKERKNTLLQKLQLAVIKEIKLPNCGSPWQPADLSSEHG